MRKFGLIFTVVFYIFNVCCMQTCFAGNYKFSEIEGLEFETERLILTPTTEDDKKILSGYLLEKLEELPMEGEETIIEDEKLTYKIEEYEDKRIKQVKICKNK